tara:strand:+ start:123 stop:533 length:411 start_codon:yes stop_codon:yes gene_type:complete
MPYIDKAKTTSWATPKWLLQQLDEEFHFEDFDPCPLADVPETDGLTLDWAHTTFCNPPYDRLKSTKRHGVGWVEKMHEESAKGKTIVGLLPARTDTTWFHDIIKKNKHEVRFLKGRLKFGDAKNCSPFPSMLVIFR